MSRRRIGTLEDLTVPFDFEENRERARIREEQRIIADKKRKKRQEIKEHILCGFIIFVVVVAGVALIRYACKDDGIYLQQCLDKGHSTNYCYKNL